MQGSIKIGRQFFIKERDNYSDWTFAFWRELFQNSIDAGSENITINYDYDTEEVEFIDDGIGMTADIRDNVYFNLGETSKTDGDTVGGFGKARIVTCFAQKHWQISSQDWVVNGVGAEYEILPSDNWINGVIVRVGIQFSQYTRSYDFIEAIKRFLGYSQLSCNIHCNIPDIDDWNNWLHKRRVSRTINFGNIYANKTTGTFPSYAIIRVNGVPMFTRYHGSKAQVIIEINTQQSREVLTSNRDGFTAIAQKELDDFLATIATNSSALEQKASKTLFFGRSKATSKEAISKAALDTPGSIPPITFITKKPQVQVPNQTATMDIDKIVDDLPFETPNDIFNLYVLHCDRLDTVGHKAMYHFHPKNWTYARGSNSRCNLLCLWAIACHRIVQIALDILDQNDLEWIPGFLITDDGDARYMRIDSQHILLINPLDPKANNNRMRYKSGDIGHQRDFMAIAAHEVAHIWSTGHNEDHANLQTLIEKRVLGLRDDIHREMKSMLTKFSKKV